MLSGLMHVLTTCYSDHTLTLWSVWLKQDWRCCWICRHTTSSRHESRKSGSGSGCTAEVKRREVQCKSRHCIKKVTIEMAEILSITGCQLNRFEGGHGGLEDLHDKYATTR